MTSSVIVTIVVILGIVVAGGFLLYFVGDLLMSISNKNRDKEAVKNKQEKEQKALEQRVAALEEGKENEDTQVATILLNGGVVEEYNPEAEENAEEATEENAEETEEAAEETAEEETAEENAEEGETEETEEAEEDDETSEYIRQRRQELMERLAKMQEENEEGEAEETEETEETEEAVETVEENAEEATEETTEETEETDTKAELASNFTLEELEAQLAEEQDKLKANEKELRQCKKDFLPLRRVKKTLESDEKKLRRKEALVAKQKVVLYGVNNYADIDEEKAKKLAEDLDLLDGLKLSVQHCEEVMSKNEERYPLLEKIYNLLTAQNEELKNNVNELQEVIAELKAQGTSDDTTTDAE